MILKLLLVIGVIAFVYFVFIKKKPLKRQSDATQNQNNEKLQSNDMIACESCGTYTEVGEAILSGGKYFCSNECLERK